MNCKYCGKELEGELDVCQECSDKHFEEKPVKETVSAWKIVAATAVGVLLLMVLAVVVINSITGSNWPMDLFAKEATADTTVGADAATEPVLVGPEGLGMSIEGITDIALYAADADAAVAAADEVVATVGNYQLTNGQLQVYYWMEFSKFVMDAAENGYDLAGSYNLDITKPMGEQLVVGSTVTWEQFFLHNALGTWWRYAAVNVMADEAGFEISQADKDDLMVVPDELEEDALEEGFESAQAMIKARLGAACTMDDYMNYLNMTARGDLYYTEYQKSYVPTEEDVKAFFELNADYYAQYGITQDSGKMAAVRHVLLVPEGAEEDASTGMITATDEQWAEGEKAAQALLDGWVNQGATEEGFAKLAEEHSTDPGSNTNGGLYEDVLAGQMVETFDAWVFEEGRKSGDYGIVRTEFGYHLMYFVGISEMDAWYETAYDDAITYGYGFNQALSNAMGESVLEKNLDKVVLTDVAQEPVSEDTDSTEPTAEAE